MPRIVSTYGPRRPPLLTRAEMLDRDVMSGFELFRRVMSVSGRSEAVLLNGSVGLRAGYVDLVAAAFIVHARRRPLVVIAECTWGKGSSWLDRLIRRCGARFVDHPSVTYCVLSREEQRIFSSGWGLDPERVVFTPYCYTLTEEELAQPTSRGGGVFAGGDPMRDYGPLVEAARQLSADVTLAVRRFPSALRQNLPPNVRALSVSTSEFVNLLRQARVVVVPLAAQEQRSSGQQTYLNAMALGKLVVVTDTLGVRDYVEDRQTGLIVPPGDPSSMAEALKWALDPAHDVEVAAITRRAREDARERFSPSRYAAELLQVVEAAVDRLPAGQRRPAT